MSRPILLQDTFTQMVRDRARNALPDNACWRIVDCVPDILGAPLAKRGGITQESDQIRAGFASYLVAVADAPTLTPRIVVIDEDSQLSIITSSSSHTVVGATRNPQCKLPTHRGYLIIPDDDGVTVPHTYDGTTLAAMSGSPPAGVFADVYKDFSVLGRTAANPTRIWFSNASNPNSWSTTDRYVDTTFTITGLAALRNALLIFSQAKTERIRGSTPPPNTDMVLEPLFDVGCFDARSITLWKDLAIFGNLDGLYMTDGASLVDLTTEGLMKSHWREAIKGATAVTIATGHYHDFLFCSLRTTGGVPTTSYLIHLPTIRWFELNSSVFESVMFAQGIQTSEELWMASRSQPYLFSISSCFTPSAANKNDPVFASAVSPIIETAYFGDIFGFKRWKSAYLTYDLRDAASDDPTLSLGYAVNPEDTTYTNLSALAETTATTRSPRRHINKTSHGMSFKISQTNASAETKIYSLEADVFIKELSRT